ncbi:hypothetical protein KC19_VG175300 [Ceratodon purpureus]|uniref:Secreted protein n=1 Tax=Ceratodon purpureus TaxID=3225 RepID=A0A8T0HS67_CERPU|nr:hypothetical protein KC19_VG175300 [Ceratodon purpureus]
MGIVPSLGLILHQFVFVRSTASTNTWNFSVVRVTNQHCIFWRGATPSIGECLLVIVE